MKKLEIDYHNVGLKIGEKNMNKLINDVRDLFDCTLYHDDIIMIITSHYLNNYYLGKNTRIITIDNNLNVEDLYKALKEISPQWIFVNLEDDLLSFYFDDLLDVIKFNQKIKFKIYVNSIAKIYENIKNEISRINFMQFIENSLMIDLCNINRKDLFYCKRLNNFELKDTYFKYLMYFKEGDITIFNKHAFFRDKNKENNNFA